MRNSRKIGIFGLVVVLVAVVSLWALNWITADEASTAKVQAGNAKVDAREKAAAAAVLADRVLSTCKAGGPTAAVLRKRGLCSTAAVTKKVAGSPVGARGEPGRPGAIGIPGPQGVAGLTVVGPPGLRGFRGVAGPPRFGWAERSGRSGRSGREGWTCRHCRTSGSSRGQRTSRTSRHRRQGRCGRSARARWR